MCERNERKCRESVERERGRERERERERDCVRVVVINKDRGVEERERKGNKYRGENKM